MKLSIKIFYLFLAFFSLLAIFGAIIYRLYALNGFGASLVLFLTGGSIWLFWRMFLAKKSNSISAGDIEKKFISPKTKLSWKKTAIILAWITPYFLLLFSCFFLLFKARTDAALNSPWQALSKNFFIAYILTTAYLFWLILKEIKLTYWLIFAHYFLSFSGFWIVFKIGYGYDPFIHQATVSLIDKIGAVAPKPFYYLGQYSLVLITHKLFFIPIVWADKLLVPVFAALTLPAAASLFLKKSAKNLSFAAHHLSLLILLILPFSIFTLTVPQNLAYLFLILAMLSALTSSSRAETVLSFILALAAAATHPIAGLPALLFVIALTVYRQPAKNICFWSKKETIKKEICLEKPRQDILILKSSEQKSSLNDSRSSGANNRDFLFKKRLLYTAIYILNSVSLPILFYLSGKNNQTGAANSEAAAAGFRFPPLSFPRRDNIFLDFTYFFLNNQKLILALAAGAAIYAAYRYRRQAAELILLAGFSATLLLAYFLTRQINFNFLISYEREDFANRILIVSFIFLLPIIAILFYKTLNRILNSKPFTKYAWLILLAALLTISFYGSYPRRDNFFNSRGFAVSGGDLETVKWIEQDAGGKPYAVLANQQVSVAALWTFGFNRYLKDGLYFYPIPTGGPLYQDYLSMVYNRPDRATALEAANLTGVNNVYFIINKYWTGFDKIIEQAKMEAGSFQTINNGELYIFKYGK